MATDSHLAPADRAAVVQTLLVVCLFWLFVVLAYAFVIRPFAEASRAAGGDLATYWADDGPGIVQGFRENLPGKWRPSWAFRVHPVFSGFLILIGYLIVRKWWSTGLLHARRASPLWMSGCFVPVLIGLCSLPYWVLQLAQALARQALTNPTIFGSGVAEELAPTLLGAQVGCAMALVWITARLGWFERFPRPQKVAASELESSTEESS